MEEDILNYVYQLSCFVGHPVFEINQFMNLILQFCLRVLKI